MRLDKYLTVTLNISRDEAHRLIKKCLIKVDNNIITKYDYQVKENKGVVKYNEKVLKYEQYVYYMLNKPAGFVSARSDNLHSSLLELVPSELMRKDLAIVGRLDIDTEGLILITNDGAFIHKITSPKSHIKKIYEVTFTGALNSEYEQIAKLGINTPDFKTLPFVINPVNSQNAIIEIYEGQFHEVKRIFSYLGTKVIKLRRIQIGDLLLDDLPLGELKVLNSDDLEKLEVQK